MSRLNNCHPRNFLSGIKQDLISPPLRHWRAGAFSGITVLVLLFGSTTAFSATYDIDPAHSNVEFKIRHLVGRVTGHFNQFSGTVEFDEKNEAASVIRVKIEADSIDTGNVDRDMHLKTADFFDTSSFPKITFVSKKVDAEKKKIVGDLTLHGVTKEVELDYTFGGMAPDKKGFIHLGGSGKTTLNRKDFGINYDPTSAMIGNEVDIQLDIEAIQKPEGLS